MILENCKNESQTIGFVAPGHAEYVGDDGGEEGLEEQAALQLGCWRLYHTKCLHLHGIYITIIIIIIFTTIIVAKNVTVFTIKISRPVIIILVITTTIIMFVTNTKSGIMLLVKHLQISVPDFGDSVVAGQTCHRETPGDHNYHNGEHIRSPYDRQKIILRSFEEHLEIIIRLYLDYH